MREREQGKLDKIRSESYDQKGKMNMIAEEIKRDLEKDKTDKAAMVGKMRGNIAEVKAERDNARAEEIEYRMKQKPITVFPYTHGDTVEASRAQIRGEMMQDMKNR